jgi:hypothetical protein
MYESAIETRVTVETAIAAEPPRGGGPDGGRDDRADGLRVHTFQLGQGHLGVDVTVTQAPLSFFNGESRMKYTKGRLNDFNIQG